MPIKKHIEDINTGASFEYWKVQNVNIDNINKVCYIQLNGYVNRDKFLLNKNKHITKDYRVRNIDSFDDGTVVIEGKTTFDEYFSPEILSNVGVNPLSQSYIFIKSLEEFEEAEDIDL